MPNSLPNVAPLQFVAGLAYPLRAIWFIHRQRLWSMVALPVVINLVLLTALALVGWFEAWPWLQSVAERLQAMAGDGPSMATVISTFTWIMWIMLLPVLWVVSAVVVLLVGHVIASPFIEMLSERVECMRLGREPAPFGLRRLFDSVVLALGDAVWGVIYLAVVYIPLIFLSLVPVVGAVVSLMCGALLLAQEFVGLSMARHFVSYRSRWQLILQHKWLCGGFGCSATLAWLVPGLNILLLPVLAVAGTLLYCDLVESGSFQEPPKPLSRDDAPRDTVPPMPL